MRWVKIRLMVSEGFIVRVRVKRWSDTVSQSRSW